MTAKGILNAEAVINAALDTVIEKSPGLRKPIAAWDGVRRVWILREHEAADPAYKEVITTLSTTSFEEAFKIEITARAWSSLHRQAPPLEESIFSAVVREGEDPPSLDYLVEKLIVGLDMVRRLGDAIDAMAEELESTIAKLTKYP